MPVARELLEIIVCPLTKKPLLEAQPAQAKEILQALSSGKVKTRGAIDWNLEEVSGLLITEDGAVAYPVVHEIPNLLPASCILVKQ